MNFFKNIFKPKEDDIILDCYTYLTYVYETAKIDHAYKFIPTWWKDTPKFINNKSEASIKNCLALKEYFKTGIVIPAWFGLQLKIHPLNQPEGMTYSYQASTSYFKDISHPMSQYSLFAEHNKVNFKMHSPWMIKCQEPINFVWSHPLYSLSKLSDKNFDIMPAVVNYKYQHDTNINAILTQEKETETNLEIEPLSPLVMIHPMSDRRVTFRYHLVSEEEWYQKNSIQQYVFDNTVDDVSKMYQNKKKIKNKIDNIDNIQCPFHGEKK